MRLIRADSRLIRGCFSAELRPIHADSQLIRIYSQLILTMFPSTHLNHPRAGLLAALQFGHLRSNLHTQQLKSATFGTHSDALKHIASCKCCPQQPVSVVKYVKSRTIVFKHTRYTLHQELATCHITIWTLTIQSAHSAAQDTATFSTHSDALTLVCK